MASGHGTAPHQQAEHMAAPTSLHHRRKNPCQRGAVHTWGKEDEIGDEADIANLYVCCWGVSRRAGSVAGTSLFSQERTSSSYGVNGLGLPRTGHSE